MQNARLAMSFASLMMAALFWNASVHAQAPSRPGKPPQFKLGVEKQQVVPADESTTNLRISRDGLNLNAETPPFAPQYATRMGAHVDSRNFGLRAQDWNLPGSSSARLAPLKGSASFAKSLSNYNIELIVDQSLSMRRRDCPGGMSRWEWCGEQLNELSSQLTPYAPRGFTLTTFASDFQTYENANAGHVQELFAYPNFSLGTRLSKPLNARLANYFAHPSRTSKPLLIVVITDGVPAPRIEPDRVAQTLINATQRLSSSNEITVVFFQIGSEDKFGRYFLGEMDHDLVPNGARYDIVRTVYFEDLQRQGLTRALATSVRDFARQASKP